MGHDVTAVIAVYNGEALLRRSIDSVLRQTSPVAELIVVDDGSTDGTEAVVRSYGGRVTYVRQANQGVAAARNAGLARSTGTWIAFLDHDDEWLPTKVERQLEALRARPETSLCYSAFYLYGIDGSRHTQHMSPSEARRVMRLRNPFPPSVVMARRESLLALGGFDARLRGASCEDWDLVVRFISRHGIVDVDEPLANYYEVETSNSLRKYRLMLANTLAIVEPTLLSGLTGLDRALWRRRIEATLYHRAATSARFFGEPAAALLLQSLVRWPLPDVRLKTLLLELRRIAGPGRVQARGD